MNCYKFIENTNFQYIIFKTGKVYRLPYKKKNKKNNVERYYKGYFLKQTFRHGYLSSFINNKSLYVHRLIAIHFIPNTKNLPLVDHINRNKSDNRISNLRWVNNKQNCLNNSIRKDNSTGYTGIEYDKINKKYRGRISINNKTKSKSFKNIEDAIVWRNKMVELHYNILFEETTV